MELRIRRRASRSRAHAASEWRVCTVARLAPGWVLPNADSAAWDEPRRLPLPTTSGMELEHGTRPYLSLLARNHI